MQVQSYLMFNGRCQEALDFYQKAIGAKVEMVMRFKDAPEGQCAPGTENNIMHSSFKVGDTVLMASDGMNSGPLEFKGISLTLNPKTEAECERLFNALADGGQVFQPLIKTFFSPKFGVVTDKFGVNWMVLVDQQPATKAA
ncbi:MAG: VOC family protein [Xanthobacteraceae bacterium]|jgi:PhnB protein